MGIEQWVVRVASSGVWSVLGGWDGGGAYRRLLDHGERVGHDGDQQVEHDHVPARQCVGRSEECLVRSVGCGVSGEG